MRFELSYQLRGADGKPWLYILFRSELTFYRATTLRGRAAYITRISLMGLMANDGG